MGQKGFSSVFVVIGAFIFVGAIGWFYQNNRVKTLEQDIAKRDEEIKYLLSDTAQSLGSTEIPYSFREFGIYSPIFKDKTIHEEKYVYKRTEIKKMTITIPITTTGANIPSDNDSDYLVEVWEYPTPEKIDKTGLPLPNPRVTTDYDMVFINDRSGIKVTPIDQTKKMWSIKNTYTNNHFVSLHNVPFAESSPYVAALESEIGTSPNGLYHFIRIRPAASLYFTGTFSYNPNSDQFLDQVTKNLKELGDTISYKQY